MHCAVNSFDLKHLYYDAFDVKGIVACARCCGTMLIREKGVPRALLLEDSTSCAIVAAGVLRGLGYRVERYGWVKAALCAIEGPRFDVYVIDAGVPQSAGSEPGSGLDVARRVLARYPDARVIVWSAADTACAGVIFAHKDAGPDGLRKAVMG